MDSNQPASVKEENCGGMFWICKLLILNQTKIEQKRADQTAPMLFISNFGIACLFPF